MAGIGGTPQEASRGAAPRGAAGNAAGGFSPPSHHTTEGEGAQDGREGEMPVQAYEQVVEAICGKRRFGKMSGAEASARVLLALGSPQEGIPFIHVAGTNGKGSVCAFLSAILEEAGLRVGLFTSPHLVDFRERIRVNGEPIPREDVSRLGSMLLETDFGVETTMFDDCLAMALLYFKERSCDAAILEAGIGGRLDSTNAVGTPAVSVITRIDYDHTEILGATLEEIAAEKAGILKKGTFFVSGMQEPGVAAVLRERAGRAGVLGMREHLPGDAGGASYSGGMMRVSYGGYEDVPTRMLGKCQYENAAAAIMAAEAFLPAFKVADVKGAIRRGISRAEWPGRMEVLRREPFLLADCAHNEGGARSLAESLSFLFPGEKFHFVMGVLRDKDCRRMAERLIPLAEDFVAVAPKSDRAMPAGVLARGLGELGARAREDSLSEALREAPRDGKKTVVFGSVYLIGEAKQLLQK